MGGDTGFQIDLLGAIRRRAPIAIVLAGLVTLAMFWIAMALPNKYTATAVLLVEPQSVNESLVEGGLAETDLNERLNRMTSQILSRARLSRIIDDLGLYESESKSKLRQEIIEYMRDDISVNPVLPELTTGLRSTRDIEINTFEIHFTSDSPQMAADVAQHLANDFIQEHIAARVKTTQTSLEFIAGERERLATAIAEVEGEIARVKDDNEESLPEHLTTNQRSLERIEADIRYAYRQLDIARSDESFWQHQVRTSGELGGEEGSPQKRYKVLELMLAEQAAKGFTDRHPDTIKVRQEMEELSVQMKAAEEDGDASDERPLSFAQQNAESERQRAELRVKGAEEDIARLEAGREDVLERIAGTPRVAEQLDGLVRRYTNLMESVRSFENLHVEATVQANMERRQLGERFRVLEPAIPPLAPSSPNRVLIIVMGMMLGAAVGGAVGIVLEGADSSFHQVRDLQGALGIPVLAAIPSILLESDMARKRRRLRLQVLGAVLVAGIGILGGSATYMYVNGAPGFITELMQGEDAEAGAEEEGAALERERRHRG